MRITYIHQHFKEPNEGGGMRAHEFVRRLANDGHKVTVISGGNTDEVHHRDGYTIIRIKSPYANEMLMQQRIKSFMTFVVKSTRVATTTPTDLVFATSTPLTVAVPAILASIRTHSEFVFEVRDLWPSVPIRLGYLTSPMAIKLAQTLERLSYARASRIIALSPGMAEGVLQTQPQANVTVVPNAADMDYFRDARVNRDRLRTDLGLDRPSLVYAGSLGKIYNIPWIVNLAAALPEAEFQIIGQGSGSVEAKELLVQHGLQKAILTGQLSKDEVVRRLTAADITISSVQNHPALEAASINKVFDSMAAGRPIIFNHDGWLSELCTREGAGWRLSDNPELAALEVRELLASPDLIESAGKAALRLGDSFSRDSQYAMFQNALFGKEPSPN